MRNGEDVCFNCIAAHCLWAGCLLGVRGGLWGAELAGVATVDVVAADAEVPDFEGEEEEEDCDASFSFILRRFSSSRRFRSCNLFCCSRGQARRSTLVYLAALRYASVSYDEGA